MRVITPGSGDPSSNLGSGEKAYVVVVKPRTIWLMVAAAAALVLGLFVLAQALNALLILFIAIVLAEGLRPLVDWLHKGHLPRPVIVLFLFLAIIAVFAGMVWLLIQPLIQQVLGLVNDLPRYLSEVQHLIKEVQQRVHNNPQAAAVLGALAGQLRGAAGKVLPFVLGLPFLLIGMLFKVLQILLFAFFWLVAADHLKGFVVGLLPPAVQESASETITEMGRQLSGYLRGVVINMALIGGMTGLGLYFLGVPYPVLIGLVAAGAETIPYIGPWISGAPAVLLAFVSGGMLRAGEVVILYEFVQLFEGNVLVPLVMNRTVHLNPLTITFGVVIGAAVLGLLGAVLAVPLTVLAQVLVLRVLAPVARRASHRVQPRRETAEPIIKVHG